MIENERKNNQMLYVLKGLLKKFVVWLIIFQLLLLFACNTWKNIALALLALVMTNVVMTLYWHFTPKKFITGLEEKAILVTGCDTGFGHLFAQKMDKKGMTVYAGCLFPEGNGAAQLRKSCSNRLRILELDVCNDEHIHNAVKMVINTLGKKELWAVVNIAGINSCSEIEWAHIETCKKTMEVNAIGPFRVTQAFLPLLRRSQGRVVTIASILGHTYSVSSGPYCMSKHAAVAFSDVLRCELMKWNVSVHSIEPFIYSTNIADEETVTKDLQKNWEATSQEVRDDYGEGYLEEIQKSVCQTLYIKRPATKLYEVIDALEHATIGKDPKIRYVPGFVGELWTWADFIAPKELFDLINYFVFPRKVAMKQ